MSDSSKYNSFTAADIERYYNGQMPGAERHALEKAALDDPFLADALEGYAFTSAPVADINSIKQRLEEKQGSKKIVPLYKWLQIAAFFLILAGSGWILYKADFFSKKEIAVTAPAKQDQTEAFSSNPSADSVSIVSSTPQQMAPPENTTTGNAVVSRKKNKPVVEQAQKKAEEEQRIEAARITTATERQNELAETGSLARKMAANNKDMAAAASPPPERNDDAIVYNNKVPNSGTDSVFGYSILQGKTAGVQTSNDTIKLNVTMQPSHENLNEVVMVHMGAKKRAVKPVAKFEELEPVEGWTNFNEYIARNLKEPEELKEKTSPGEVELSFEINKEGEPINIKVEKSLCSKCDEEAVRLLKEGPKWKKKSDKKGKMTIHF